MRCRGALRALLDDTRPDRPKRPRLSDVLVSLVAGAIVTAEALARPTLEDRATHAAVALVFAVMLAVRAVAPMHAVVVAFSVAAAHTISERGHGGSEGLFSALFVLALPYALVRFGSRREVAVGGASIATAYLCNAVLRPAQQPSDLIGGAVVLLFPAVLAAAVRTRDEAHQREIEHARGREREALARELHDTVAHHVAAVTIQAQAAQAVLAKRPEAALGALRAIEEEAGRALHEMRRVVGALKTEELTTARIESIDELAKIARPPLVVHVEREGSFEELAASVHRAAYRIAQEAITNAVKHGRDVTKVSVRVEREAERVRVTVSNDGAPATMRDGGFGLWSMRERAQLLGGTLSALPLDGGGFRVEAVIPCEASER
ncbi:MAG: histidine kinase [Polyangiales bacterium]